MFKNLKITLFLENYAVVSPNPFDGVLAKLWFEKEKQEGIFDGDFFKRIPFLKYDEEGFYHISNPIFEKVTLANQVLHKNFDVDRYFSMFENEKKTKGLYALANGRYKSHQAYFEKAYIKEIVFYACGDLNVIKELLQGLTAVGKKSSYAWGKINKITIEEISEDWSIVKDKKLMRHVPLNSKYLEDLNEDVAYRLMPLTHPYWDRGREAYSAISIQNQKRGVSSEIYKKNELVENTQKRITKLFGFEKNFKTSDKVSKLCSFTKENTTHKCKMCGITQQEGFMDAKNTLIGTSTNAFYDFVQPRSPFVCSYCQYAYANYKKNMQTDLDKTYGDFSNIIIFNDFYIEKNFNSNEENEMYDIFVNPPKEAFTILMKNIKGNTFVHGSFKAIPTIDSELIVINYGVTQFYAPRAKTLECIAKAEEIFAEAKKKKINVSEDILFNRSLSESYNKWFTLTLRNNAWFLEKYNQFINAYSQDVRFIAKTMLLRYRKEIKNLKIKGISNEI